MSFELRSINSSKKYYTGSVWDTNSYGKIKIVGQCEKKSSAGERVWFRISFLDGFEKNVTKSSIRSGQVKNPYSPDVCGIGFIGEGLHNSKCKEYMIWSSMLCRCYDAKYQERNPSYIGCSVDKRWFNFQLFCEDIKNLLNYNLWIDPNIDMELDKDSLIKGNKFYSKETCMFVTPIENCNSFNRSNKGREPTGLNYLATRISDGFTYYFTVQSEFCNKFKLDKRNINACLKGKRKTHKGWRFEILDE